jgi:hypothetical protein
VEKVKKAALTGAWTGLPSARTFKRVIPGIARDRYRKITTAASRYHRRSPCEAGEPHQGGEVRHPRAGTMDLWSADREKLVHDCPRGGSQVHRGRPPISLALAARDHAVVGKIGGPAHGVLNHQTPFDIRTENGSRIRPVASTSELD